MVLNRNTALFKKFDRSSTANGYPYTGFWETETINGIEVYKQRMNFYANAFRTDKITKNFVTALGIEWSEFIGQKVDSEIETMFFYLKPGFKYSGERAFDSPINATLDYNDPTSTMIADKFQKQFVVDDIVEVTIKYGGDLKKYITEHDLGWVATGTEIQTTPLNTEEIRTVLASNPWYYYANSRHVEYTNNIIAFSLYDGSDSGLTLIDTSPTPTSAPVCNISTTIGSLGVCALLDAGSMFEPVMDEEAEEPTLLITDEQITTSSTTAGEVLEYTYTLSFRYKGCTTSSNLITNMLNWYNYYYEDLNEIPYDLTQTDQYNDALITSQIDTKIKRELIELRWDPTVDYVNPTVVENSLYLKVPDYITWDEESTYTEYLKVDAVKKMKKKEFVKLLSTKIATDYTVEKKKWWEKALAFVIIIVAVVVAVFNPPAGVAIAAVGGAGSVGAFALTIAVFAGTMALVISIGAFLLAKVGGLSAQSLVKMLGNFAAVLGVVSLIAGIYASITAYMSNLAAQQLVKEGTIAEIGNVTAAQAATKLSSMSIMEVVNAALSQAKTAITEAFKTAVVDMSITSIGNYAITSAKYLLKAYDFYMDQEKKDLEKELQAEKNELEQLNDELAAAETFEPGTFMLHHERLSSHDSLQEMAIEMDSRIGRDQSYSNWDAFVNRT